jgi:HSP20 family protein
MSLPTRVSRPAANEPYDAIQRDFDNVLGRLFLGSGRSNGFDTALCPVDVREDADHIYVDAEMPGFKKEEIDITLENLTLTISAQRSEESHDGKEGEYLLNERRQRRYVRSFSLPSTVNEQSVNAKLQDGVLRVTLDKREETKPRKISVA